MGKRNSWSSEDIKYLKDNYGIIKSQDIVKYLNRSFRSVRQKARRIGVVLPSIRAIKVKSKCLNCDKDLEDLDYRSRKFCNHTCSSIYNNSHRLKRLKSSNCLNCGIELKHDKIFQKSCSQTCNQALITKKKIDKWLNGTFDATIKGGISSTIRKYLLKQMNYKCSICKYEGYNDRTGNTVLEIDHIDGNSDDSSSENLRVICPNCHAKSSTFRSLNKKSSKNREHRKKYYKKAEIAQVGGATVL